MEDNSFDFTSNRSGKHHYQENSTSNPPTHVAGKIEWPSQTPGNAQTDFVVISNRPLTKSGSAKAIETLLASGRDLCLLMVRILAVDENRHASVQPFGGKQHAFLIQGELAVTGPPCPQRTVVGHPKLKH